MSNILEQINEVQSNIREIKSTWGQTIMTLDNIKTALRADRQKAIDEAYHKGFEAGSHEATTLEYQQGLEEGKKQAKAQAHLDVCHDIERVARANYQKGLNDAWGTIIKIALIPYAERSEIFDGQQDILSIVQKFSPSEVTAKLSEYEQQKADKRIMFGDGLVTKHGGVNGIALSNEVNRCVYVWREDCVAYEYSVDEWKKTGKTYPQVAELLEAMKEGAE